MAATGADPVSAPQEKAGKNKIRQLFSRKFFWIGWILPSIIFMVAVSYISWKFLIAKPPVPVTSADTPDREGASKPSGIESMPAIAGPPLSALEPFKAIPLNTAERNVCLDVSFKFQFEPSSARSELEEKAFILHEIVVSVIKQTPPEAIQDIEGKILFKKKLLQKLNAVLEHGVITHLFFSDFLIRF